MADQLTPYRSWAPLGSKIIMACNTNTKGTIQACFAYKTYLFPRFYQFYALQFDFSSQERSLDCQIDMDWFDATMMYFFTSLYSPRWSTVGSAGFSDRFRLNHLAH